MSILNALIAGLLALFGYTSTADTSTAHVNSCSNVNVLGTYDRSGLQESGYGISAVGTFRIQGEEDEGKQPMFNLAMVNCEYQPDDSGKRSLECKLTKAVVWADAGNPDTNSPNCSLDLDSSTFSMKELQKGVLTGIESSSAICINTLLTIDRNTKRVYLSFTKTKEADDVDKKRPGTCGTLPRTEVLMNCTGWARSRKDGQAPPRYCDFSGINDK
jgi:hypothetical protein